MIQKSRGPTRSPCKKDRTKQLKVFLRWHGPHQVLRVEAVLPLSQKGSPDFVTHHKHLREFCQGLVFIRKKGYDSTCYGEPLWLRGNNRFRPDEPDVGNANVGTQHKLFVRSLFRTEEIGLERRRGVPKGTPPFCMGADRPLDRRNTNENDTAAVRGRPSHLGAVP